MRRGFAVARFALLVWLVPAPCLAQQSGDASLRVRVTDAATQQPLVGAHVTFPDRFQFWITDPSGNALVTAIPPGEHRIEITMPGYTPVQAQLGFEPGAVAEADVELSLESMGVAFGPLTVRPISTTGQGDGTLRVRVTDAETRQPLVGATVTFPGLYRYWITDTNGDASVTGIPPGQHQVEVTSFGYGPVRAGLDFGPGAVAEADVALLPRPIGIEGVSVTVTSTPPPPARRLEQSGFIERSRRGIGRQITRLEIEQRNALQPSDVFRGMPNVRLVPGPRLGTYEAVTRGGCRLDIYVDGVRWSGSLDGVRLGGALDDVGIGWIEGIEVYTGAAQTPVQYSGTSESCGVILIWTG